MQQPVVIVGLGQLGGVFAHGLLRAGRPVIPITRDHNVGRQQREIHDPSLVLVCVGEAQLAGILGDVPEPWLDRVGLVQNELLPRVWRRQGVQNPTVAVVWFEKKANTPIKPLLPTVVHGPVAGLLAAALDELHVPVRIVDEESELLHEMVAKNLYILTLNLAGLKTGGTAAALAGEHRELMNEVAGEVLDLQAALTGEELDRERLQRALLEAIKADPEHGCRGRTAPERLKRALKQGRSQGLELPTLQSLTRHSS